MSSNNKHQQKIYTKSIVLHSIQINTLYDSHRFDKWTHKGRNGFRKVRNTHTHTYTQIESKTGLTDIISFISNVIVPFRAVKKKQQAEILVMFARLAAHIIRLRFVVVVVFVADSVRCWYW